MKLTIIGGTGLIGSQVVQKLTAAGHQAGMFAAVGGDVLTAGPGAHLAPTRYQDGC